MGLFGDGVHAREILRATGGRRGIRLAVAAGADFRRVVIRVAHEETVFLAEGVIEPEAVRVLVDDVRAAIHIISHTRRV